MTVRGEWLSPWPIPGGAGVRPLGTHPAWVRGEGGGHLGAGAWGGPRGRAEGSSPAEQLGQGCGGSIPSPEAQRGPG